MALPTTGQLTFSQINVELGNSASAQASMYTMASAASLPTSNADVSNFYGYSHVQNITLAWGAETSYSYGSYRLLTIANRVSPQIITINFTYKIGWINSTWYIYSSKNSTSSWTQEAFGFAGSGMSGAFTVTLVDYNDDIRIRWSPSSVSWSAFGTNIALNNGTLTSGTPVVSVIGTGKWYII